MDLILSMYLWLEIAKEVALTLLYLSAVALGVSITRFIWRRY